MNTNKLFIANWKMNGSKLLLEEFAKSFSQLDNLVLCPPYHLLDGASQLMPQVGAQDCSVLNASSGAYTGDVSATMLQELGCKYVILGHSERRQYYNETSELVNKKAQYVHSAGMLAIICVGESQAERSNGQSFQVVKHQLLESMPEGCNHNNTIIAYEPCWAIGSGNAATVEDITEMHDFIGMVAQGYRIIYGGSVNPSNAGGILSIPTVGGVLIGGASLRCDHLQQILG